MTLLLELSSRWPSTAHKSVNTEKCGKVLKTSKHLVRKKCRKKEKKKKQEEKTTFSRKSTLFIRAHHTNAVFDRRGPTKQRRLVQEASDFSVHNEHASSRDSSVPHMHTLFWAVVAHTRNLAERRARGSEGCVIHDGMQRKSWALNFHTLLRSRPLNPTHEPRVPKNAFSILFNTNTILKINRAVASHRDYNAGKARSRLHSHNVGASSTSIRHSRIKRTYLHLLFLEIGTDVRSTKMHNIPF